MLNFTTDQWIIVALVFVLGLLVGGFLFSGGGRKWKHRYNAEVDRRDRAGARPMPSARRNGANAISLRAAALKGDRNADGVGRRATTPTQSSPRSSRNPRRA